MASPRTVGAPFYAATGNSDCHADFAPRLALPLGDASMLSASALIAISLILLLGLGIAALFLAGRESRSASADDLKRRD